MGTNFLSLCTGSRDARDKWKWHPENESADAWRDLLAAMEEAVEIADRHDVLLGVEPEAANAIKDAPTARRLLDEMKSDRIKIIIDPANLFEKAENVDQINYIISQAFDLLKDEIMMAHAKDRTLGAKFRTVGRGDVDFRYFVEQLKQIDFDGPLVMHGLEENEVAASVEFLKSFL